MNDKRHFTRIKFDVEASLSCLPFNWDTPLIDISLHGALVSKPSDCNIQKDDLVTLKLPLSDSSVQIVMTGKAAHIGIDHIGIVCDYMDIESATHLRRMVELNTGSSSLLERELTALCDLHNAKAN